jgi:hypothetical protein
MQMLMVDKRIKRISLFGTAKKFQIWRAVSKYVRPTKNVKFLCHSRLCFNFYRLKEHHHEFLIKSVK